MRRYDLVTRFLESDHLSLEERQQRKCKMNNCKHSFVIIKRTEPFYGHECEQDSHIVECVKCGLTNRFKDIEAFRGEGKYAYLQIHKNSLETETFQEQFKDYYSFGGRYFNNNKLLELCMSNKILNSYHPRLLYELALIINPKGNKEELFDIMTTLNQLEKELGLYLNLPNKEEIKFLLKKYYEITNEKKPKIVKVKIKKKTKIL